MRRTEPEREWLDARTARLHELLKQADYKGHDPFDIFNSPIVSRLVPPVRLLRLAVNKFGARMAPDRLRRLLRVPPIEDPKIYACCYFAYRFSGIPGHARYADLMIERLVRMAGHSTDGAFWGYRYYWPTREDGTNPCGASAIVPMSFALLALLHERRISGSDRFDTLLNSAFDYLKVRHLKSGPDGSYLGYFAHSTINTHNAGLLGCAAMTLGGRLLNRADLCRTAAAAAVPTVQAVGDDGFLAYHTGATGNWTDCFHHLYVLAALRLIGAINPYADGGAIGRVVERMQQYAAEAFEREDGLINYYPGKLHPIDPHNYAAAALYGLLFDRKGVEWGAELLERLDAVAWDRETRRYVHRIHEGRTDRRLFIRWNQVWMLLALSAVRNGAELPEELRELYGGLIIERE